MTYDELVRSVETAAAQKNNEILQRANREAEEIIREAEAGAAGIRERYVKGSLRRAEVERNRQIYLTSEEIKAVQSRILQDLFSRAFLAAAERLKDLRESPRYPDLFGKLLDEAVSSAGKEELVLYTTGGEKGMSEEALSDHGISEIRGDIGGIGGVLLKSRDGKVTIHNTIESRLEKAKEIYKLEIFRILTGE